jgi:hypothetical protein
MTVSMAFVLIRLCAMRDRSSDATSGILGEEKSEDSYGRKKLLKLQLLEELRAETDPAARAWVSSITFAGRRLR